MKPRLYLDEDSMDYDLVQALRSKGIYVRTVRVERKLGLSDEEHLLYAAEQGRVIYRFNRRDYMALHTTFLQKGISHAGIILAPERSRYSVGEQLRRIMLIIEAKSAEEMKNQALFLSNWG